MKGISEMESMSCLYLTIFWLTITPDQIPPQSQQKQPGLESDWYQFIQWVDYYARINQIVCIAVPPHFTSIDCSVCGAKVSKTLSTRTHQCPNCQTSLDRDHNAAINILKKGLQYLGVYLDGTVGQKGTDPNACGESDHWFLNCEIEELSRLIEAGISNSDVV